MEPNTDCDGSSQVKAPVAKNNGFSQRQEDEDESKKVTTKPRSRIIGSGPGSISLYKREIVAAIERMLDGRVSEEALSRELFLFSATDYDDLVTERSLAGSCGYPLCDKELDLKMVNSSNSSKAKGKYKISLASNRIYDMTAAREYCSPVCLKLSRHVRQQIPEEPIWSRMEGIPVQTNELQRASIEFLKISEADSKKVPLGDEIDLGILRKEHLQDSKSLSGDASTFYDSQSTGSFPQFTYREFSEDSEPSRTTGKSKGGRLAENCSNSNSYNISNKSKSCVTTNNNRSHPVVVGGRQHSRISRDAHTFPYIPPEELVSIRDRMKCLTIRERNVTANSFATVTSSGTSVTTADNDLNDDADDADEEDAEETANITSVEQVD